MSFVSFLLAKLHAEFNEIRGAAHVPPQLHTLMDELVARFHALEHRVEAALHHQAPAVIHDVHEPAITTTLTVPVAPADTPVAHANPGIISMLTAGHENDPPPGAPEPATASAPGDYSGHLLEHGHPRINVEQAGVYGEYHFTGPGTVYYQICYGCDSGMRVTSYIADRDGVVSEPETRVIMNKQPFTVDLLGDFTFYVKPEATGPISVGLE